MPARNDTATSSTSWLAAEFGPTTTRQAVTLLDRASVSACLADVDVVEVVRAAFLAHDAHCCDLPGEAYLRWYNSRGGYTRSIAMPAAVANGDTSLTYGMKIINASVSNPALGLPRASGIGLCFDAETARITTIMDAGLLSALRTAAVSVLAIQAVADAAKQRLSIIGCGAQGGMHAGLALDRLATLGTITLYDQSPLRAEALAERIRRRRSAICVQVADDARTAVNAGQIVVLTTTAPEGYVEPDWIATNAIVVNVSLSDLTDSALISAGAIYVDDFDLVTDNPRRSLGRLVKSGLITGAAELDTARKRIDGTIGGLLSGRLPTPTDIRPYTVINPFGMGILDVAIYGAIRRAADRLGIGHEVIL